MKAKNMTPQKNFTAGQMKQLAAMMDERFPAGDQGCYISQVEADATTAIDKLTKAIASVDGRLCDVEKRVKAWIDGLLKIETQLLNTRSEQRDILFRADRERARIKKLEEFRDSNPIFMPTPPSEEVAS